MKTLQDIQARAASLQFSSSSRDLSEAKCLISLINEIKQRKADNPTDDELEVVVSVAKELLNKANVMAGIYEKIPSASKMLEAYKNEQRVYATYIPTEISYEAVLKHCSAYTGKADEENFMAWAKRQDWYWNTTKETLKKILDTLTIS